MPSVKYFSFHGTSDISYSSVLCLGTFDGIHLGHKELIDRTIAIKKSYSNKTNPIRAAAFCFSTLPINHFIKEKVKCIMSLDQKIDAFKRLGLDGVYVCDFPTVCSLSPREFVDSVLFRECKCVGAVCGFNFTFGAGASGDSQVLSDLFAEKNYPVDIVNAIEISGQTVSSSLIREYIESGNFLVANRLLGTPFSISHRVVHGKSLGAKLGFPTINHVLDITSDQIIPAFGIYTTKTAIDDKEFISVTNIGVRPTVSSSGIITCETHLIDVDKDCNLYGNRAKVSFFKRLRGEKKFNSEEELSAAIANDVIMTKEFFSK